MVKSDEHKKSFPMYCPNKKKCFKVIVDCAIPEYLGWREKCEQPSSLKAICSAYKTYFITDVN